MRKWLFRDSYCYDDSLFFWDEKTNCFVKINLENNLMNYASELTGPKEKITIEKYIETPNGIFALTEQGEKIFHISGKIGVDKNIIINANHAQWGNYACVEEYKGILYIFTKKMGKIVEVDIFDYSTRDVSIPYKFQVGCRKDNTLLFVEEYGESLICYDLEMKMWTKTELNCRLNNRKIVSIECTDETVYLMNEEGDLYEFNLTDGNNHTQYNNLIRGCYTSCMITKGKIVMLPSTGNDICIFDRTTKQHVAFHDYPQDFCYEGPKEWSKYMGYSDIGEYRYYSMRSANYILKISHRTGEIKFIKPIFPKASEDLCKMLDADGVLKESDVGVDEFINYILVN